MREVKGDIHIHSCLSPCGDLSMSPRSIVEEAHKKGLEWIALTDHNTAKNCRAVCNIAQDFGITAFAGMEVTVQEEAHILTIFSTLEEAEDFSEFLYTLLPPVKNKPERFGDQVVVDEDENVVEELDIYLGMAVQLSVNELCEEVKKRNGLFIPAHIDRPSMSLPAQLGYLPQLEYTAVERAFPSRDMTFRGLELQTPIITNSDAHFIENIGDKYTLYRVEEETQNYFSNLKKAIKLGGELCA